MPTPQQCHVKNVESKNLSNINKTAAFDKISVQKIENQFWFVIFDIISHTILVIIPNIFKQQPELQSLRTSRHLKSFEKQAGCDGCCMMKFKQRQMIICDEITYVERMHKQHGVYRKIEIQFS